jgi:hypothetical protein
LRILLLGVNHKTVPLDVREAASFSEPKVIEALPALQGIAGEAVAFSTRNRTEIHVTTSDEKKVSPRIERLLSDFHGLPSETLSPRLIESLDDGAVRHLFKVASGLDSLIIGESENPRTGSRVADHRIRCRIRSFSLAGPVPLSGQDRGQNSRGDRDQAKRHVRQFSGSQVSQANAG